jgi:hypothetical protein
MVRVQIAFGPAERHRLLQSHHDRVGKPAQQHDDAQNHIHDADALVIDGGEPLFPEIAPQFEVGQRGDQREATECDDDERADHDRFVQRQRFQREATEKRTDG